MLTHGQAEKEEKTPTVEVSNYMLTADSNLGPPEWSLDDTNVSSLRQRKVLTNSDRCNTSQSPESNTSIYTHTSPTSNLYRSTNLDEKYVKSRKLIAYPKITAAYPRIVSNNKIHPKDVNKIKKLDGRYVKPPSSQPPVFLRCKVKKKTDSNDDRELDDVDESSLTSSATTDLDIQFGKINCDSFSKLRSYSRREASIPCKSQTQSLQQYCNFDEKTVTRIAPQIRRKDVICDTVDAWSHSKSSRNSTEWRGYKPLIFGGTYPIDLPVRSGNELCLTEFEGVPVKKLLPKTYDIDAPTDCE